MAYQASDLLGALQYYNPGVDLSNSGLSSIASTEAANGTSPADFASKYAGSPQVASAYQNFYQTQANPTIAATNSQIGVQQNAQQLSDQQEQNSANTENNDTSQSIANINRNRQTQNDQIFNSAAASGNSTAGGTLVQENNNNVDTQRNISYADAQRANTLSQLALQNTTNKNQIQGSIDQLQGEKAVTEQGVATNAMNATTQNSVDQRNLGIQQAQVSENLPYGRTIQTGPYTVIQGMQTLPTQLTDFVRQNVGLIGTPAFEPLLKAVAAASGITLTDAQANQISSGSAPAAAPASSSGNSSSSSSSSYTPPVTNPAATQSDTNVLTPMEISDNTFSSTKKELATIFEGGASAWQGKDAQIIKTIQSKEGVNADQASALYYTIRKELGYN